MMHFGKRPMVEQAPVGEFDDLYLPQVIVGQQSAQQPLQLVEPGLDGSQYSVFINPLTERLADLAPGECAGRLLAVALICLRRLHF